MGRRYPFVKTIVNKNLTNTKNNTKIYDYFRNIKNPVAIIVFYFLNPRLEHGQR
jgi:hypothetical protein